MGWSSARLPEPRDYRALESCDGAPDSIRGTDLQALQVAADVRDSRTKRMSTGLARPLRRPRSASFLTDCIGPILLFMSGPDGGYVAAVAQGRLLVFMSG
jgi:glycine/D-amino acid oxidase-like deaminating enzyme